MSHRLLFGIDDVMTRTRVQILLRDFLTTTEENSNSIYNIFLFIRLALYVCHYFSFWLKTCTSNFLLHLNLQKSIKKTKENHLFENTQSILHTTITYQNITYRVLRLCLTFLIMSEELPRKKTHKNDNETTESKS